MSGMLHPIIQELQFRRIINGHKQFYVNGERNGDSGLSGTSGTSTVRGATQQQHPLGPLPPAYPPQPLDLRHLRKSLRFSSYIIKVLDHAAPTPGSYPDSFFLYDEALAFLLASLHPLDSSFSPNRPPRTNFEFSYFSFLSPTDSNPTHETPFAILENPTTMNVAERRIQKGGTN